MDLSLTEEESMLVDLACRWVSRAGGVLARRNKKNEAGRDAGDWAGLAETGLLSLNVPQAHGGTGANPAATFLVMEQFGRGAVVEPYVATAVVSVRMLSAYGTPAQQKGFLPGIATGDVRIVPAVYEADSRFELGHVQTRARHADGGYVLKGRKARVDGGNDADVYIVSARADTDGPGNITLFLVDANATGLARQAYTSIDGTRGAHITLDEVFVPETARIVAVGEGLLALEDAIDHGLVALCAEAAGLMGGLLDQCVEHLKTRRQFGHPLSDFQALQHKAVEMLVMVNQARAIALAAASELDGGAPERRRAASAAKALTGRVGRLLGEQAIQLHGGIGMTDELPSSHYFKRLACIDMTWGDSAHHLQRYAALQ